MSLRILMISEAFGAMTMMVAGTALAITVEMAQVYAFLTALIAAGTGIVFIVKLIARLAGERVQVAIKIDRLCEKVDKLYGAMEQGAERHGNCRTEVLERLARLEGTEGAGRVRT